MTERFYPKAENLGKPCKFWNNKGGCRFPKFEMEGRTSCEGVIDDICLWLKNGRTPTALTPKQMLEIKTRPPTKSKHHIPPGNIVV